MNETSSIDPVGAVVIGTSSGAVDALLQILSPLPSDYPLPLMIVVHLPPNHESTLPGLLAARCQIAIKEAEDKEPIQPGTAYLAPPNYHLLVEPNFRLSLSVDEPLMFSRPSIDALFESAADAYGDKLAGLVLTGANSDGTHGLQRVCEARGLAFVQSPAEAASAEMPQSALDACPSAQAMSLSQLADLLKNDLPAKLR